MAVAAVAVAPLSAIQIIRHESMHVDWKKNKGEEILKNWHKINANKGVIHDQKNNNDKLLFDKLADLC